MKKLHVLSVSNFVSFYQVTGMYSTRGETYDVHLHQEQLRCTHSGFESRDGYKNPKQGYQWPLNKTYMCQRVAQRLF